MRQSQGSTKNEKDSQKSKNISRGQNQSGIMDTNENGLKTI